MLFMIAAAYFSLHLWIVFLTYTFRKSISPMTGMMISMALGMTSGLGVGAVTGMTYPQHLFETTTISILIGSMVGVCVGLAFGLIAILDGFLSGVMAGMMGTMFGVMIPSMMYSAMYKVIACILITIIFLVFLLVQQDIKANLTGISKAFKTTLPTFIAVIAFLFIVNETNIQPVSDQKGIGQLTRHDHHSNNQKTDQTKTIVIEADDFTFSPSSLQVKKGSEITLVLQNKGKMEHDFEIINTDVHIHASPQETNQQSYIFNDSGTYQAYCTIPGHKEKGMIAEIKVF